MKKAVTILLLIIHFFNVGGQLVVHQFLVYQSDKLFNEQINLNRYNIKDLTEIKVKVNMPGITEWSNFENISGQIQFEKTSYNYVKMRITRNAIYFMCIPNYETTHLSNNNIINAKPVQDVPVSKKEHVSFGKANLLVCNYQVANYKFLAFITMFRKTFRLYQSNILYSAIAGPSQPPDLQVNFS